MENEFSHRFLGKEDLHEIIELQNVAIANLNSPDMLQPLTQSEFEFILGGHGCILGLFDEQKLIGIRAMLVPPFDQDHLGFDAGLSLADMNRVIYQELSIVHPKYRGAGLQTKMGLLTMEKLDRTKYSYVFSTVAPSNIASMKDKFVLGLHIIALKLKYNGKLRYVFMKNLDEELCFDVEAEERLIPFDEVRNQQQATKEGFMGVGMQDLNGWKVLYRKCMEPR